MLWSRKILLARFDLVRLEMWTWENPAPELGNGFCSLTFKKHARYVTFGTSGESRSCICVINNHNLFCIANGNFTGKIYLLSLLTNCENISKWTKTIGLNHLLFIVSFSRSSCGFDVLLRDTLTLLTIESFHICSLVGVPKEKSTKWGFVNLSNKMPSTWRTSDSCTVKINNHDKTVPKV